VDGDYRVDRDGDGPAAAFTVPDRDFNTGSLRGNAILRWEWRPGSTLFFVWRQARSNDGAMGDFDLDRDRAALFDTRPQNVFVIKATYWLNP
jgi:hypothetical protein